jgi:hypothetical protein
MQSCSLGALLFAALCVTHGTALADGDSRRYAQLHWVQTIAVKEGDSPYCKPLRLSEADIKSFFSRATLVPEDGFHHRDWLPCYAEGFATNHRQRLADWNINAFGTAVVQWSDGRKSYFACDDCLPRQP